MHVLNIKGRKHLLNPGTDGKAGCFKWMLKVWVG
jgi:hypothetical protein